MKYLVYYYNLLENKYCYRLCGEVDSAYKFTNDLLNSHITKICYIYTLYGRKGKIRYEEED